MRVPSVAELFVTLFSAFLNVLQILNENQEQNPDGSGNKLTRVFVLAFDAIANANRPTPTRHPHRSEAITGALHDCMCMRLFPLQCVCMYMHVYIVHMRV